VAWYFGLRGAKIYECVKTKSSSLGLVFMHIGAKNIGLFPLGIFLLPNDYTRLHIFEQRYKDLIQDCLASNTTFGILSTLGNNETNLGAEVRVVEVTKQYQDGRMDILVKSEGLFKLIDFHHKQLGKQHPGGTVERQYHLHNLPVSKQLLQSFSEFIQVRNELRDAAPEQPSKPGILDMVHALELEDSEKVDFARLETPAQQEIYLQNYLDFQMALCRQETATRYLGFYLN
jgi:ATP-dependent Lon protease